MFTYILIYLIIILLTYKTSARVSAKGVLEVNSSHEYYKNIIWPLIIMIIFIGFRYNVGRDFPAYESTYKYVSIDEFGTSYSKYKIEYGFFFLVKLLQALGLGPQSFFFFSSLITIVLFLNLYKETPQFVQTAIIIFFLSLPYNFIINGIRQGIALMCVLNGIKYIAKDENHLKDAFSYAIWILAGAMFHTTALLAFIFYPLKFDIVKNRFNSVILCAIAISGFVLNSLGIFDPFLFDIVDEGGYSYGSMMESDRFVMEANGFSLGRALTLIIYLIPLLFYDKLSKTYPDYKVYFILFSIGCFIFFLFPGNMLATRVAYYFLFSEVMIYPLLFEYKNINNSKILRFSWYFILLGFVLIQIREFGDFFDQQIWNDASVIGIKIK